MLLPESINFYKKYSRVSFSSRLLFYLGAMLIQF